ncbi:MAG: hypothetical protein AMXMBFR67_22560 [Nitrospira sp.]
MPHMAASSAATPAGWFRQEGLDLKRINAHDASRSIAGPSTARDLSATKPFTQRQQPGGLVNRDQKWSLDGS